MSQKIFQVESGKILYSTNNIHNQNTEITSLNKINSINETQFKKLHHNFNKFIYKIDKKHYKTKNFGNEFIKINHQKAYLIINNKRSNLSEKILNGNNNFIKIKFKLLDNMFNINSMFKECLNLIYIDDGISNWKSNKLKKINNMFYGCSSLKSLSDISKWNTKNIKIFQVYFLNVHH